MFDPMSSDTTGQVKGGFVKVSVFFLGKEYTRPSHKANSLTVSDSNQAWPDTPDAWIYFFLDIMSLESTEYKKTGHLLHLIQKNQSYSGLILERVGIKKANMTVLFTSLPYTSVPDRRQSGAENIHYSSLLPPSKSRWSFCSEGKKQHC